MDASKEYERPIHFAFHAVAHIDLLGQSEALQSLDAVPLPCTEEQLRPPLRATLTPVVQLREMIVDYFASADAPSDVLDSLPTEQRAKAMELRTHEVVVRSWSDTTVVTVPLRNEANPAIPKIVGIYRTFVAVAGIALAFLVHRKLTLRGGIDLGKAVDIPPIPGAPDNREIYGAVIERAYKLENRIAQYPRIVIGETLLRLLDDLSDADGSDPAAVFNAKMAKRCKELLVTDPFDGRAMLDHLGAEIREQSGTTLEQLGNARDFIAEEHRRFVQARNDKLSVRYRRLLHYADHALSQAKPRT